MPKWSMLIKKLLMLFVAVILSQPAMAKLHIKTAAVRDSAVSGRNMICPYFLQGAVWKSYGAFYAYDSAQGLAGISLSMWSDIPEQSFMICSTHFLGNNNQGHVRMPSAKILNPDSNLTVDPKTCEIPDSYIISIEQNLREDVVLGHSYQAESSVSTDYYKASRLIDYYILDEENSHFLDSDNGSAWANQKCLDLFPGSIRGW